MWWMTSQLDWKHDCNFLYIKEITKWGNIHTLTKNGNRENR